jgi:zinc transport system substrate-binding protein
MIVMARWTALLLAALLLPALAGCSALGGERSGKPQVATSFYPLQYLAQRIAGPHFDVVNLTQPGKEPHDVELTVRQTAELVDADVVVYERGFQPAVDDAVDQSHPGHAVDVASVARLDGSDPHFWLDPVRFSAAAGAVEKQIAAADPAHRAAYAANLAALRHDLAALDASYRKGLASCRITTVVVSHDAFGYLGRRYGLHVVGINGLSPEAEPSPAHIRALQDLIRQDGIRVVFSEQLASREFADSLAHDLGIKAEVLDPIEGLSDATADQDYLSLMRRNLATLREANQCS